MTKRRTQLDNHCEGAATLARKIWPKAKTVYIATASGRVVGVHIDGFQVLWVEARQKNATHAMLAALRALAGVE
jgi:hypothetical protein